MPWWHFASEAGSWTAIVTGWSGWSRPAKILWVGAGRARRQRQHTDGQARLEQACRVLLNAFARQFLQALRAG